MPLESSRACLASYNPDTRLKPFEIAHPITTAVNTTLIVDLVAFAVLIVLSSLVRSRFHHHNYSPTGAGGIVMGIGIFADFSLPQLPFHSPILARLITLELFVIWLFLAASYCAAAVNGHFRMHIGHPLRRFAIGTWVAGTAVLAVLAARTMPEARPLEKLLTLIAVAVYLPYVGVFVHGYYKLLRRPFKQNANGAVLLATVSTQSIVIALATNFSAEFPDYIGIKVIAFDMIFLFSGLVLIALHYHAKNSRLLAVEWQNANCIVHGAVSITGLALVLISNFDGKMLLGVWEATLVLLVVVELLELVRLVERFRQRGFRRAMLVYDTSQWTRNFTFGMFYAFSFTLYHHLVIAPLANGSVAYPALQAIVNWGQYAVLAALLAEIGLFLRARLHLFWHVPGQHRIPAPR